MTERELQASQRLLARESDAIGSSMKIRFYPFVPGGADGVRLHDLDGNEYLDFVACGGVAQTGYRHPRVQAAVEDELAATWSTAHCCFPSVRTTELAEILCALVPGDFEKRAWFGTTGSDANDALVSLLPGATGRRRIISFVGAYHGLTAGSAGISGHSVHARLPGSPTSTKVPYPDPLRCPWGPCSPDECSLKCLNFLESYALQGVSPAEDTAAVVMEAVQSDGGDVVPPENYIPALRQLCDQYGVWLVFDEVKTGLGRTGAMFAFQHANVVPDAVTLGKPLGGGLPLSAVVGRRELLDQSQLAVLTLGGSPVPAAGGLAVIATLAEEDLITNARDRGKQIMEALNALKGRHPLIGDVRGRGLLIGVELVEDAQTMAPAARDSARVAYRCFELGLLVIYCGMSANVLEMTPPLTITSEDVDEMLEIFDAALTHVERGDFDDRKLADYVGW